MFEMSIGGMVITVLGFVLSALFAYMKGVTTTSDAKMDEIHKLSRKNSLMKQAIKNQAAHIESLKTQKRSTIHEAQFWKRTAKNLGWHKGLRRTMENQQAENEAPVPVETIRA